MSLSKKALIIGVGSGLSLSLARLFHKNGMSISLVARNINKLDNDRIYQELFLYMAKNDIDEEISRINSHLNSFTNLLNKNEPCGRKLDFLSQELNREANTIGAKSSSLEISSRIVETKTLIEQIREQVQNIE